MKVKSIMNPEVAACHPADALTKAAQIMWQKDCGCVPVVDPATSELVGMVTDRDIAMAALLANRPVHEIPLSDVMCRTVASCKADETLRDVHARMRKQQVRRLPVVDKGKRLIGLVTLNDLINEAYASRSTAAARRQREVGKTLAKISEHRATNGEAQ